MNEKQYRLFHSLHRIYLHCQNILLHQQVSAKNFDGRATWNFSCVKHRIVRLAHFYREIGSRRLLLDNSYLLPVLLKRIPWISVNNEEHTPIGAVHLSCGMRSCHMSKSTAEIIMKHSPKYARNWCTYTYSRHMILSLHQSVSLRNDPHENLIHGGLLHTRAKSFGLVEPLSSRSRMVVRKRFGRYLAASTVNIIQRVAHNWFLNKIDDLGSIFLQSNFFAQQFPELVQKKIYVFRLTLTLCSSHWNCAAEHPQHRHRHRTKNVERRPAIFAHVRGINWLPVYLNLFSLNSNGKPDFFSIFRHIRLIPMCRTRYFRRSHPPSTENKIQNGNHAVVSPHEELKH